MFEKSDVLDVRFTYADEVRVHKSITRLPEGITEIVAGTHFSITADADAKVGRELEMTLSDISGRESLRVKAVMVTADYLKSVNRGWLSTVEVKSILDYKNEDMS